MRPHVGRTVGSTSIFIFAAEYTALLENKWHGKREVL